MHIVSSHGEAQETVEHLRDRAMSPADVNGDGYADLVLGGTEFILGVGYDSVVAVIFGTRSGW